MQAGGGRRADVGWAGRRAQDLGEVWPRIIPESATFDILTELDRCWVDIGQLVAKLAQPGHVRADFGRMWAEIDETWTRFDPPRGE